VRVLFYFSLTICDGSVTLSRMARKPLILITPGIEKRGFEFSDLSVSLAVRYENAILAAGGIPVIAPVTSNRALLAEAVRRTDGVMLTGGDDINPALYEKNTPKKILKTVVQTPDNGARDSREWQLIKEVFRQRKPVLAICRGHQMMNVAFGGKLIVDIAQQVPGALKHQQSDRAFELVHEAALTPGSLVAKICGGTSIGVNSTHHQAVVVPAKPFVATAMSADGIVEVMELKPAMAARMPFFLSVQFHPERLVQLHARYRKIFGSFVAACGE
jgi:putative glutamine amidotransferase